VCVVLWNQFTPTAAHVCLGLVDSVLHDSAATEQPLRRCIL
jgi:hypothetical protein